MKRLLLLIAALLPAPLFAAGLEGIVSLNHTNATNAKVFFASGKTGLRVVTVDVASDLAGSVATWRVGSNVSTLATAPAAAATNLTLWFSALTNNDVVILSGANGQMTNSVVYTNTPITNQLLTFSAALGTNAAVGDLFRRRVPTVATTRLAGALSETNFFIDTTNATGLATGVQVLALHGGSVSTSTVHQVSSNLNSRITLRGAAQTDLATNTAVFERLTNSAVLAGGGSDVATNLHVATTNGFGPGSQVLIETAAGDRCVRTVHAITATNIALTTSNRFAFTNGDVVWLLTNGATVRFPAVAGDRSLILSASNALTTDDILVAAPSTNLAWVQVCAGGFTLDTNYVIYLTNAFTFAVPAGATIGNLTNVFTNTLASSGTGTTAVTGTATNLTRGDIVYLLPTNGGVWPNIFLTNAPVTNSLLSLVNATSTTLVAGDSVHLANGTITNSIGAATVRTYGEAVFAAPADAPAMLNVNGTARAVINQATAIYER